MYVHITKFIYVVVIDETACYNLFNYVPNIALGGNESMLFRIFLGRYAFIRTHLKSSGKKRNDAYRIYITGLVNTPWHTFRNMVRSGSRPQVHNHY